MQPTLSRMKTLAIAAALATVLALAVVSSGLALDGSPFIGTDAASNNETAGDAGSTLEGDELALGLTGKLDNAFGQGAKEDQTIVNVVTGSIPPNKNDLTKFWVGSGIGQVTTGANHMFLYLAWTRAVNSGSANLDFEFNQASFGLPTTDTKDVTLDRTADDILVLYDFGGSGAPTLRISRWIESGACEVGSDSPPCWGKASTITSTYSDGSVSSNGLFGEAVIDLVGAEIVGSSKCFAASQAWVKSRSSTSLNAELKDFIAPSAVNIDTCGHIIVDKVTVPGGDSQLFEFDPSWSTSNFSLADATTPRNSGDLAPGTYSFTETLPTGWDFTSATCTITAGGSGSTGTTDSTAHSVTGIALGASQTVTCVVTNTKQGSVSITKVDDDSPANKVSGATFTVYSDAAMTTSVGSCSTTASANPCTVSNLPPATYYVKETTVPTGYSDPSPISQSITLTAGQAGSLSFTDPRKFKVIVLVCRQSDSSLYASSVTFDSVNKTSLGTGGGGTLTDASLCALGGASYADKAYGNYTGAAVNIPQ